MWVVAELDDDYIAKMEHVLEVYERPYDPQQPVICLDEKSVTLHADVRPTTPAAPGREARQDHEYKRCGTANVFCAVEPKAGRHAGRPRPRHGRKRGSYSRAKADGTAVRVEPNQARIYDLFLVHASLAAENEFRLYGSFLFRAPCP